MADGCRLDFERWVPEAAKSELQRLAEEPGADHRLLQRLASYQVMRDEVWKKLPAAARGRECLIIRRTYAVAGIVEAWQKLEDFRKHSSLRNAKKVARLATKLLDAMKQTSSDASELSVGEQLTAFYRAADEKYEGILEASANLAPLRKKNAKNAGEIVFARHLTACFQHDFGKPLDHLDHIVAALSSVVFDKGGEGALAPTIRGRRRSAPRKGTFAGAARS
jgi:hypothetical protein